MWQQVFTRLTRFYGITPQEISQMTLGQVMAYIDEMQKIIKEENPRPMGGHPANPRAQRW